MSCSGGLTVVAKGKAREGRFGVDWFGRVSQAVMGPQKKKKGGSRHGKRTLNGDSRSRCGLG